MIAETFLQKFIQDSFQTFNPELTSLTFADGMICMFWSILLSFSIAVVYRYTHKGLSYSQSFTQTLVLLGSIVSIVMLIVGTDIARAFTLVGALSIVRFRNAVKETRDVGFIFFVMVIGMACGVRFYALAIIFTVIGCGLIYIMYYTQFGQKNFEQDILELTVDKNFDYSPIISPLFTKNLKEYSILSIDAVNESQNRLSFMVTFRKKNRLISRLKHGTDNDNFAVKKDLITQLQAESNVLDVKLISGANTTEI